MEIRKDEHGDKYSPHLQEDYTFNFRDDEDDDEEENRFIISLDDVDESNEEEIESNQVEHVNVSKNGPTMQDAFPLRSHSNISSISPTGIGVHIREDVIKKTISEKLKTPAENVLENDVIINSCNVKDGSNPNTKYIESSSLGDVLKQGNSNNHIHTDNDKDAYGYPSANVNLRISPDKKRKNKSVSNFTPHENCSCIMCYRGRGIVDSALISKAAKRKIGEPPVYIPSKGMKLLSSDVHHMTNLTNQPSPNGLPSSVSGSHLSAIPGTFLTGHHTSKNMSLSSPILVNSPNGLTDYFLIVPHTSSSGTIKVSSSKSSSNSEVCDSVPSTSKISVLSKHISSASLVSKVSQPIVSNLSSTSNFTYTTHGSSLMSAPKPQMNASASDKRHVVLINNSTVEKQLAGLQTVMNRATKVDLSKPGVVLVHYNHSSSQGLLSDGSKSSLAPISTASGVSHHKISPSNLPDGTENPVIGLVKHHLVNSQSIPAQKLYASHSQSQASLQLDPRQRSLLKKPHLTYSPELLSSFGHSRPLPPPPPLLPRPSSISTQSRLRESTGYNHVEIVNLRDEQTETMVLPLPRKNENLTVGDKSINLSKQDENQMLLSPSLFTFSSPLDLSPKNNTIHPSTLHNETHLINPSSSSLSKSESVLNMGSSSVNFNQQNVKFSSASSCSTQMSEKYSTVLSGKKRPISSTSQHYSPSELVHGKTLNTTHSSSIDMVQSISHPGVVKQMETVVRNANGLKIRIRFKEKSAEEINIPQNEGKQLNVEPNGCLDDTGKKNNSTNKDDSLVSHQINNKLVSENSKNTNTTNDAEPNDGSTVTSTSELIETAEEMFKRFEDQAMRQVYNAQFGVGNVSRSLRPNRTTMAATDFIYASHHKGIKDTNKKKDLESKDDTKTVTMASKMVTMASEPIKSDQSRGMKKSAIRNKRKRCLSAEARQELPLEKTIKLDINQYPKLLQDNSIVNRKTIYTPNILAGHKVFVKFNVFSNSQSGRSFLLPFFNIGGSRTQFDVEDMEYINTAVVEFEKEEKSCARHLIYYSREGKKATFLRKESGLHSNELTSKSYKKQSFILQGYSREKSKKTPSEPTEDWRIDRQVLIEIDRAEQDVEYDLTATGQKGVEKCKDEKEKANKLAGSCQSPNRSSALNLIKLLTNPPFRAQQPNSSPAPLPADTNSLYPPQPSCARVTPGDVDDDGDTNAELETEHQEPRCHRDKVNILKKRAPIKKTITSTASDSNTSSTLFEAPFPSFESDTSYIDDLKELVKSRSLNGKSSFSSSCDSLKPHYFESSNQGISSAWSSNDRLDDKLPSIKTEVPDDGYEAALMLKENQPPVSGEIPEVAIKSEPIDDYTECLAKSMNINLQQENSKNLESLSANQSDKYEGGREDHQAVSQCDNLPLEKMQVSSLEGNLESSKKKPMNMKKEHETGSDVPLPVLETTAQFSEVNNLTSTSSVRETENVSSNLAECVNSEVKETSEPNSSPLSGSSSITSSSEVENSSDDCREENEFSLNLNTLSLGVGAVDPLVCSENVKTPAASNKITSLVESLKQRLVQTNQTFSCLFTEDQSLRKKKKSKKKRKNKVDDFQSNLKGNSPLNISNSIFQSDTMEESSVLDTEPSKLTSIASTVVADTVTTCDNKFGKDNSELIIGEKPSYSSTTSDCATLLTSSSSLSSLTSASVIVSASTSISKDSVISSPADKMSAYLALGKNQESGGSSTFNSSAFRFQTENGFDTIISQSSDHLKGEILKQGKPKIAVPVKEICHSEANLKESDSFDDEVCLLTESGVKPNDAVASSVPPLFDSSKDTIEVNAQDMHSQNGHFKCKRDDEVFPNDENSVSRSSTPCSEIDVGCEEILSESPVSCTPLTIGPFVSNPPLSKAGKAQIKDLTKQDGLIMPIATGPKSHPNDYLTTNIPVVDSSIIKRDKGMYDKKSSSELKHPEALKKVIKEKEDSKLSFANLLCQKLSIEVEPLAPKVLNKFKAFEPTPMFTKTKELTTQEQLTPSSGSNSFYKPTLSAIFGVDAVSLPKIDETAGEEEKTTEITGKRRQVAVKGSCRRKSTLLKSNGKLSPLKLKEKNSRRVKCKAFSKGDVPIKEEAKHSPQQSRGISEKMNPKCVPNVINSTIKEVAETESIKTTARRQNFKQQMQSVFRTWRQLSHEQKNKSQVAEKDLQKQFCLIPCKVLLEKLEDSKADSNGQSITPNDDSSKQTVTEQCIQIQGKVQRSVNCKKKKRSTASKLQKRKQPREKKDIVDYYASVLENLRKKAQMLEEESMKKNQQTSNKEEHNVAIKIEPTVVDEVSVSPISQEKDNKYESTTVDVSEKNQLELESEINFKDTSVSKLMDIKIEQHPIAEENTQMNKVVHKIDAFVCDPYKEKSSGVAGEEGNPRESNENEKDETCLTVTEYDKGDNLLAINTNTLGLGESQSQHTDIDINPNKDKPTSGPPNNSAAREPDQEASQSSPVISSLSAVDNSYHSDSSESGELVIDFGFDTKDTEDTGSSKPALDGSTPIKTKSKEFKMAHDISDLVSDSSFNTKDIVLGFENELGADTVFSTLPQADEDLFLMGDGEEDNQVGMIPEEEVEKLLGLDVAGDEEIENPSICKQQKANDSKGSSGTTSTKSLDQTKLCWIPVSVTESKSEEIKCIGAINLNENHPVVQEASKSKNQDCVQLNENSSDSRSTSTTDVSSPKSSLQIPLQQNNHPVSPSWNRLLGREALMKMKSTVPASSQQLSLEQAQSQGKPSVPTGKLKVCVGALSKALKLSAEMKKVFSSGQAQSSLAEKSTFPLKTDCSMSQSKESLPTTLSTIEIGPKQFGTSNILDQNTSERHPVTQMKMKKISSDNPPSKKQSMPQESPMEVPPLSDYKPVERHTCSHKIEERREVNDDSTTKVDTATNNICSSEDFDSESLCMQGIVKKDTSAKRSLRSQQKTNQVSDNKDFFTDVTDISISRSPKDDGTSDKSLLNSNSFSPKIPFQTFSKECSNNGNGSTLFKSGKGIDLSKLKMKLNPLLFSKKKMPSSATNVKSVSINNEVMDPSLKLVPEEPSGKINVTNPSFSTKNEASSEQLIKVKEDNYLSSLETRNEPVLNTAKLCDILKNVKNPQRHKRLLRSKTSSGQTASQTQPPPTTEGCSSEKSIDLLLKGGLLTSAHLALQTEGNLKRMESSPFPDNKLRKVTKTDEKKGEDEDTTKRSFFDCLPDVMSGAWEKS